MPNSPTARPPGGAQLTPGEKLLLTGLRAWAAARTSGETPQHRVLSAIASKSSNRAAALFSAWIQAVEADSLRPIQAECDHCGGAAPDLQRLVVACGVAPVAFEMGERLLEPLVSDPRAVMILARSLNAALASSGWPLPARLGSPSAPGRASTVH